MGKKTVPEQICSINTHTKKMSVILILTHYKNIELILVMNLNIIHKTIQLLK